MYYVNAVRLFPNPSRWLKVDGGQWDSKSDIWLNPINNESKGVVATQSGSKLALEPTVSASSALLQSAGPTEEHPTAPHVQTEPVTTSRDASKVRCVYWYCLQWKHCAGGDHRHRALVLLLQGETDLLQGLWGIRRVVPDATGSLLPPRSSRCLPSSQHLSPSTVQWTLRPR